MAEVIKITDDGVTAKEELNVKFEETKVVQNYNGTLNDLTSEIDSLTKQITNLTSRKNDLETKKTNLQVELDKLADR